MLGFWMMRTSFQQTLPSSLLVWWLREDDELRDPISRVLARIVGGGFLIVGVWLIVIGSVAVLRHLLSA